MKNRQDTDAVGEKLYERLLAGDTAALSYTIRAVENNRPAGKAICRRISDRGGRMPVVGFTGPPGVGKSTLIDAYIACLRKAGKRVAVVAVDPSSPISGGSILGDRFRMSGHIDDPDVFIRSVSSRGQLGGLCAAIFGIIDLVDVAGWDVAVLETVGAGQSDTEVADIADIKIVVQAPGLGDSLQAIKAGILEIADVLVVNKADLPEADKAVGQLQAMMAFRGNAGLQVPIIKTVATERRGLEELQRAIDLQLGNGSALCRKNRYQDRLQRFFAKEVGQAVEHVLATMDRSELLIDFNTFISGERDIGRIVEQFIGTLQEKRH